MLTSISLANAGALWAGLLIPLLVVAYLKTRRDKSLVVSSLLILRSMKQQAVLRSRIKLPLRFYLELLVLLALLLAAALPTRPQPNKTIAIVVDNSLSMQALDRSGKSRLDLAKEHARSMLGDLPNTDRVAVFSSSPKLFALAVKPTTPNDALEQVANIQPSASSDNLTSDLKALGESGRFQLVVAISDEPLEFIGSGEQNERQSSGNVVAEVRGIRVGTPVENYYVANLRYTGDSVNQSEISLVASYGWSGLAARNLSTVVENIHSETGVREVLKRESITLSPNKMTDVSFVVGRRGSGSVEVRLEAGSAADNAIKLDDRAWLPPQGGKKARVMVVSSDVSLGVLGLDAISSLHFQQVTPENFAKLDAAALAAYELLVFHQSAPRVVSTVPSLFILPPDDNIFFPVTRSVENGQITSWLEQHPLTSYLRVPLLPVKKSLVFSVPLWSQSVINVEQGSVVVAGESVGVRYAGVGMEILPFEGERTPAQSVLTINIINWLLGSSGSVGSTFVTGATYAIDKRKEWRIVLPDGRTKFVTKDPSQERDFGLTIPGIYRFQDDADGEPYDISVNCFHPAESATAVVNPLIVPQYIESPVSAKQEEEPVWPMLIKVALAILVLDWCYRLLGRARNVSK